MDKGKRIIAVISAGHVGRDKADPCAKGIPGGLLPHLPSPHVVLARALLGMLAGLLDEVAG